MLEKFVIGIIGSPFGLDGKVKVKPFSGDIENILKIKKITMRQQGKGQELIIEESLASPPYVLMRFKGYSSPEEVKTLSNAELLIDRKNASPLASNEFYIEDLKGLAVTVIPDSTTAGEIIGFIIDIVEGGGGYLVEIKLKNGELKLVPFRKEFFPQIDLKHGRIVLENLWILE